MIQSTEWVLNAILHRYPPLKRETLSRFLSPGQKERFAKLPTPQIEPQSEEPALLDYLHWSWLLPFFKSKTGKEQKLFMGVLPADTQEKVAAALSIKVSAKEKESLKNIGKEFLLQQLHDFFTGEENKKLPLYLLPPSPLNVLLRFEKQELIRLIDFIALYDLAAEIKKIVDTKILKKIHTCLAKEEKACLAQAAFAKNLPPSSGFPLKTGEGTEKELRLWLHKRGLARLGLAISGQHPDFTWYLSHRLDSGRGSTLAKHAESPIAGAIAALAITQINEILRNFFS